MATHFPRHCEAIGRGSPSCRANPSQLGKLSKLKNGLPRFARNDERGVAGLGAGWWGAWALEFGVTKLQADELGFDFFGEGFEPRWSGALAAKVFVSQDIRGEGAAPTKTGEALTGLYPDPVIARSVATRQSMLAGDDGLPRYARNDWRGAMTGSGAGMTASLSGQRPHFQGEALTLSRAVLASVLNTSLSTVRQWEIGDKHPSGPSLKLLSLLDYAGDFHLSVCTKSLDQA